MNKETGFTLIEVIVVLLLLGLLAAFTGMGVGTGTEGYILAKENAALSQKGLLATTRLRREIMSMMDMAPASAGETSMVFTAPDGTRTISVSGSMILIDGDRLIDGIDTAGLAANPLFVYLKTGGEVWGLGDGIAALYEIQIDFSLNRNVSGVEAMRFQTSVNPRNTGNLNGPFAY